MEEKLKKYLTTDSHEILNEFSVGIIICNNLYEVLFVNRTFLDLSQFYDLDIKESSNLKSIFNIGFFNDESLKQEISLLQKGLPFESEISSSDFSKRGLIKLIIKATPLMENGLFSGAIFIIEDLRVAIESTTEYIKRNADLQRVIEQTSDFFIILDKELSINQYSINLPIAIKNYIDENNNPSISDIIYADDIKTIIYYLNYTKLEKRVSQFLIKLKNQIDYQCKIIPITNKLSEVVFYYLFFDKIDSRTNLYRAFNESQINYSELLKKADTKFVIYDLGFNIIEMSENYQDVFIAEKQLSSSSIVYQKFIYLTRELLEKAENILKENQTYKTEIQFTDKLKNHRYFELKFFKIQQDKRVLFINDLTDIYRKEKKLKKTITAFESTINNSPQMVNIVKPDGEIVFANDVFCEQLGYDKKNILTKSFYRLIDPNYLEKNIIDLSAFKQKKSSNLELPFITSTGDSKTLLTHFVPIKTLDDNFIFIAAYFSELEKIKLQEAELNFYKEIIQNSFDGIALVENSRFINANNSFLSIFGFESEEELEGRYFMDVISDDDTIRVSEFLRLVEIKKQPDGKIDFIGRKRDNSKIYIEMSVGKLEIESRIVLILSAREVTEKIKAHRELRESEDKYRSIAESLDDCLFTFEKVGFMLKPVFCTSSIKKITGYNKAEFLSDSKFFFRIVLPEDYLKIKPKLIDILKSKTKKNSELEFRIVNKEGNVVWIKTKLIFQRSLSGNLQKVYGLMSDITVSKSIEEENKQITDELVKLNDTKDKFISIVSHDLRTPFTSILGFTDLLQNDETLSEAERKQYVKFIRESAQTMLSLVNSVLDWTRLQTGRIKFEPEKTNVTEIIKQSINSLSALAIQKSIRIYNLVDKDIYLYVDKNLLSQVFNNLISNAIKFTKENGRIDISATPNSNNTYYIFSVKDNGIGMKREDLDKIFSVDSKFSTDGTAGEKGSGLGLSLVKEIVEKHNGKIWVESQYQKGSDFQFSLPLSSAIILLVESDNADKMLYSKLIKNFKPDFLTYTESTGAETLQHIKQYNPALVITNHSLPDMSGLELIRQILKLNLQRKLQVIVIGSKIDKALMNDYYDLGVEFILNKPINVNAFQQAIEKSIIKVFQKTRY